MLSRNSVKTTFEPERTIQPIYTGGSVALDETGCVLATCLGEDALVTDLRTGGQLARIEGDGEMITSLSLTPSASHIILCSRSLSMRIYSLEHVESSSPTLTPQLRRTLKPHPSPVITSVVDETGALLATGGADGVVKVWDIRGGYVTHTFRGHSGVISALRFFEVVVPDAVLETGISARNRKKSRRKSNDDEDMNGADSHQETTRGFRLASGAEDGKVRIWDLYRRKYISTLDSHVSVIRGLSFSPEEQALVSASRDKTVIIWDCRTWKVRRLIPVLESLESLGFIGSGTFVFTGGENGRVRVWETDTGREVTREQPAAEAEGENIVDLLYHRGDPSYLLSIHGDQSLILLSLEPLSDVFPGSNTTIPSLPEYRRIAGTHDEIIDLAYLTPSKSYLALATNSEDVQIVSIATSPPSSSAHSMDASAVTKGQSHFGASITTLAAHSDIIICLTTDWSGHWLATGSKDNTAILWRLDLATSSYKIHATFTGHAESLGAVALPSAPPPTNTPAHNDPLSHPPPFLLTGSQDRTIKRWSIPRQPSTAVRALYTRKAHEKDINALDVSPSSALFASASQDRLVKIYSTEEGEPQGILRGHRRGVWSVKFAPSSVPALLGASRGLILTGSGDKTVKVWSLADYSCLLTLEGHTGSVLKAIWLPPPPSPSSSTTPTAPNKTETQLASAGGDGLVKIWSLPSGALATTLDNHTDRVWCLASSVTPSGTRHLISASSDSTLTLWTDTTSLTLSSLQLASTHLIESEQRLANLSAAGDHRAAIGLALSLDRPARLLALLTAAVDAGARSELEEDKTSISGLAAVDDALASLGRAQVLRLLGRVRDWNTNARTAVVAQRVLGVLVRAYAAEWLAGLGRRRARDEEVEGEGEGLDRGTKGAKGTTGIKEVVEALASYTERHYKRLEMLEEEAWVLEYTLAEMADGRVDTLAVEGNAEGGVVVL